MIVVRRFQFCAGHRIAGHESKCKHVHGHNYVALVAVRSGTLDDLDRVVDFGVIKEKVGKWIDENWDHGFLVSQNDPEFFKTIMETAAFGRVYNFEDHEPTAEVMAACLFAEASGLL